MYEASPYCQNDRNNAGPMSQASDLASGATNTRKHENTRTHTPRTYRRTDTDAVGHTAVHGGGRLMSSESQTGTLTLDPVDASISLHGIVCELMDESGLRENFEKTGAPWSQCVAVSHDTIRRLIDGGDIPAGVCDCDTFEEGALPCFRCHQLGIREVQS